ncbi:hypothetical protein [Dyella ginsengisoli]|uniref:hypothetical protein n=1 Tax=Dyella ginsengisoli TaxID=363848 RepID=UPI00034A390C|nr:hypothetical protein [Dyella ginsengisoli]
MKSMLKNTIAALILMMVSVPALAGIDVIVSAHSNASSMSKDDVSALYLGRTQNLPGGGKAKLYDLPDGNAGRDAFYTAATGKSASQVKAVWSRLVFSGRAVPPTEVHDDAAMVKAVAADPQAVGYVASGAANGSVKVVAHLP